MVLWRAWLVPGRIYLLIYVCSKRPTFVLLRTSCYQLGHQFLQTSMEMWILCLSWLLFLLKYLFVALETNWKMDEKWIT